MASNARILAGATPSETMAAVDANLGAMGNILRHIYAYFGLTLVGGSALGNGLTGNRTTR